MTADEQGTTRERIKAALRGQENWQQHGSAIEHARYAEPAENKRCRCRCGCKGPLTHYGMANGLALMGGCEMHVRRWVRDPFHGLRGQRP